MPSESEAGAGFSSSPWLEICPLVQLRVGKTSQLPNAPNGPLKEAIHSTYLRHKKLDCEVIPPVTQSWCSGSTRGGKSDLGPDWSFTLSQRHVVASCWHSDANHTLDALLGSGRLQIADIFSEACTRSVTSTLSVCRRSCKERPSRRALIWNKKEI